MSANSGYDEDRESYDFSQGLRGKYSERLGGPDAPWVRDMALRDTQRWAAECLLRFQELEGLFVAYFALLHERDLREASKAASEAIQDPRSKALKTLLKDLSVEPDSRQLAKHLVELVDQRNWFVHRSFHTWRYASNPSEAADRVSKVASRLLQIDRAFYKHLLRRCEQAGISPADAAAKTDEVIQRWAAA